MAGYSGTPLPQKLGIKPGLRVALIDAPANFEPEFTVEGEPPYDVILAFFTERIDLQAEFPGLKAALSPAGGLWIAWRKKSSKVATDLDENAVRDAGLAAGLVDNKVCAVTEVWSALRFVYRLKDRPPVN